VFYTARCRCGSCVFLILFQRASLLPLSFGSAAVFTTGINYPQNHTHWSPVLACWLAVLLQVVSLYYFRSLGGSWLRLSYSPQRHRSSSTIFLGNDFGTLSVDGSASSFRTLSFLGWQCVLHRSTGYNSLCKDLMVQLRNRSEGAIRI
jgi:hypothetical protein